MWAPIQNFCSFFIIIFMLLMRGEPPEPILNAGNDDFNISLNGQPCKFQPCPGFYKLPTAVDGIRQESQSLENAAHLSKTAFLALHLLSLSVPTHSTHFTKQEPSCQSNFLDFLDWRNYGATWLFQNLALDGFDLVFGSTVLMQKCQWEVFTKWSFQFSMAVLFIIVLGLQNSEHTVRSNEEGVWQVLRKWGQRDFVPLRSS